MTSPTLLLAGSMSVVSALAFAYVAREAGRRSGTTPGARLAGRAHAMWWGGLAVYLLVQGALTIAAGADRLSETAYMASRVVTIPLLCAGTWGITFYLTYLYTGSTRAAKAIGALYVLVSVVYFYAFYTAPGGIIVERWIVTIDDSSILFQLAYALVGLPPILASIALLLLVRRVRDPERRYRMLLLGGAILAYVGSGLAARVAANDFVIFLTLVILGVGAAIAAVAAYSPPARWRTMEAA